VNPWRHHRAQRARIGGKQELVAERSFARRPKPILNDHVDGAASSAILLLRRGKFGRLDVEIRALSSPRSLITSISQDAVPVFWIAMRRRSAASVPDVIKRLRQ